MSIEAGNCQACGRPFSPTHDADAPGPTSRHIFRPPSAAPSAPPGLVEPFPGIVAMVPMVNTTAADREDAPSIRRDLARMQCVMCCPDWRAQPCPDCPLAPFTLDHAPPED